jgi:hypothetical protein
MGGFLFAIVVIVAAIWLNPDESKNKRWTEIGRRNTSFKGLDPK